jgi:chromodomain-containing protein
MIKGEEEYEVEHVVNHQFKGRSRQLQYFVKWKGYPKSDNTWEPASAVPAPDLNQPGQSFATVSLENLE